jgi:hypothetical protein
MLVISLPELGHILAWVGEQGLRMTTTTPEPISKLRVCSGAHRAD